MINALFLMCVIIIAGIAVIPEVNSLNDVEEVIVLATRMYALIEESPYYNSTEYWIFIYSEDQIFVKDLSEQWSAGFAYWNVDNRTSICNMIPEIENYNACGDDWLMIGKIKEDSCWGGECMPLLWHELKHLQCECKWHENMTSKKIYVNIDG